MVSGVTRRGRDLPRDNCSNSPGSGCGGVSQRARPEPAGGGLASRCHQATHWMLSAPGRGMGGPQSSVCSLGLTCRPQSPGEALPQGPLAPAQARLPSPIETGLVATAKLHTLPVTVPCISLIRLFHPRESGCDCQGSPRTPARPGLGPARPPSLPALSPGLCPLFSILPLAPTAQTPWRFQSCPRHVLWPALPRALPPCPLHPASWPFLFRGSLSSLHGPSCTTAQP